MFLEQEIDLKNNSVLISNNNIQKDINRSEQKKLKSVFDSVLIHAKNYGLTSNYFNLEFAKYHVTNQEYVKISNFIEKSNSFNEQIQNPINNKEIVKNCNLLFVQNNCLLNKIINFQNYFKNNFFS
ncbi:hypothetical protein IKS57_00680 [bacterium]|nr:hypothetical protein [bacterium]